MSASLHALQLPELIWQIFSHVDHRATLAAACRVCKAWYAYLIQKLWHGAISHWDRLSSKCPSNLVNADFISPSSCQLLDLFERRDLASFSNSAARIRFFTRWCSWFNAGGIGQYHCRSETALAEVEAFRMVKPLAIEHHIGAFELNREKQTSSSQSLLQMLSADLQYLSYTNQDPSCHSLLESVAQTCPGLQCLIYGLTHGQTLWAGRFVNPLSRLTSLTHVGLFGISIGDPLGTSALIKTLAELPLLKSLTLSPLADFELEGRGSRTALKEDSIDAPGETIFPQLRALVCDYRTYKKVIPHLSKLQTLETGAGERSPVPGEPLLALASHCRDLRHIDIGYHLSPSVDMRTFVNAVLDDLSYISSCSMMRAIRIATWGKDRIIFEPKHMQLGFGMPHLLQPWQFLEQFKFDAPAVFPLRARELMHIAKHNQYLYQLATPTDFNFLELAELAEEEKAPMLRYFGLHAFEYPGGRQQYERLIDQHLPGLRETWVTCQPKERRARQRWKKLEAYVALKGPRREWQLSPLQHYTICGTDEYDRVLQQIAGETVPDRQYPCISNQYWGG